MTGFLMSRCRNRLSEATPYLVSKLVLGMGKMELILRQAQDDDLFVEGLTPPLHRRTECDGYR